ncbi:uncharacterized protein LOC143296595 [Babylonia areolata]|uniref:uncharacterized protein LOC143296595 n=1 Tax=Babylonia areolata TaxID=304850 RepID=UPI003FD139D5
MKDEEMKQLREEERRRFERKMELRQEELEAHTAHQFPLVPYDEKDDFDSFLNHFERVAGLNKWKRSSWAARLVALLQGRARDACLRLQPEQLHDYDILKAALLYEFRLDADSYRKRFRSMRKLAEETFDQFLGRLKVCFSRWCVAAGRDESDAEDIKDLVLQEQFLTTLNPDLVTEVRREEPNRVEDVAHITTKIVNARRAGRMAEAEFRVSKKGCRVSDRSFNLGAEEKGPPHGSGDSAPNNVKGRDSTRIPACFNCGKPGHLAKECRQPKRVSLIAHVSPMQGVNAMTPTLCASCASKQYSPRCEVSVNGHTVQALRDTGAQLIVVARRLVRPDCFTGATVRVVLAESRCSSVLPIARVDFQSPFIQGVLDVAVMESPVEEVLIGNYAWRGDGSSMAVPVYADPSLVGAVQTRAQAAANAKPLPPLPVKDIQIHVSREDLQHQQNDDPDFHQARMCGDIKRFVLSCDRCQKTVPKGRVPRVPLVKMPLMTEPFSRVAVDIVGPIAPASESGCRYILTMVDYATRYPEAVPLKDITSESVAEALFNMWTRTGIPSEVLTDRGTQFTSQVMQEVYRLLSVRGLTTTPYHAQCNGLVERFNATLKTMLRRLSHERPRAWDRWIPALLFAYREVPQESTGYSPFELLYGRTVRGPMQILREHWLHPERSEVQTAAEYVVDLRNKIAESCTLAQQNLEKAARRYKRHFDAKAKRREFAEGSRVLLLRPSKHNKLELEWQGPYTVLRRVGLADYCVRVGTKEKLYHANLLKQYVERIPQMSLAIAVVDDGEIWEETRTVERDIPLIPLEASEGPEDVVVDPTNPSLKEAVLKLVREFGDVLTDLPGRTNLETCSLQLNSDTPLRTKQYPLPYSQREVIQEEVDQMLKMGVIEPSSSPYSSPIVLVKKRDGKVRFCVDFRRVNKVTTFDAEPMPDVEALFAKLAGKRVFSKLDLSKGYWQIPMEEADRPKTAFSTPQGHFQWRVMPFGLKTAGAVFSRMMRKLILPLGLPEVGNFMDDMIIASVDEASHLPLLRAVFHRLRECSLTARPAKCYLGHKELDYLGHHVGDSKIWPDDEKMEKIHNATRPQTKRQLRGFLGLVGYYRRFVPQFAEIALPLTDKTKGKEPAHVKWDESCERAFLQLKQVLCSRPVCLLPDLSKPFVLRTDASAVGLGALLLQDHGMGPQPVACASKKLNAAERNYPTIERECLALVWGIQKFEPYLYGKPFVVQTDHAPLQYLDRARTDVYEGAARYGMFETPSQREGDSRHFSAELFNVLVNLLPLNVSLKPGDMCE